MFPMNLADSSSDSDDPHHPLLDGWVESRASEWAAMGVWELKGSMTVPTTSGGAEGFRFPTKLVLSIVMCALLVFEAMVYAEHHNAVIRDSVESFWHHFLPAGQERGSFILKDLPQTLAFIEHTTRQYYRFPELLPGVYKYCLHEHCDVEKPSIKVWYMSGPSDEVVSTSCALSLQQPRGPFGHGKACLSDTETACKCIRHLTKETIRVEVTFQVITTPAWNKLESVIYKCFQWRLRQVYDLSHNTGMFTVRLYWDYTQCTSQMLRHPFRTVLFWCNAALLLCAVLDIVSRAPLLYIVALRLALDGRGWRRILRCLGCLESARRRVAAAPVLSRTWLLWALFSDLCTICSAVITCFELLTPDVDARMTTHLRWMVLGVASLTQFLVLGSFLEHDPRLYLLFHTLRNAFPTLAAFIVSSSPLFAAFALYGTTVFGKHSPMFRTVPAAAATLFAVLNGDSVDDAFVSTRDGNAPSLAGLSRVYVGAFVCLSIYLVANVCRVIVVEAYSHFADCVNEGMTDRGTNPSPSPMHSPGQSRVLHSHHHSTQLSQGGAADGDGSALALCVHLLLSAAVCAALSVYGGVFSAGHNGLVQDTEHTMVRLFLPPDEVDDLSSFKSHLYTLDDVQRTIRKSVHRYFALASTTPSFYELHRTAHGRPVPPVLTVRYLAHGSFRSLRVDSDAVATSTCNLTAAAPLGPFGAKRHLCKPIPHLASRVLTAEVSMAFLTKPRDYHGGRGCIQWRVAQRYDFQRRDGLVPVTLQPQYMSCAAPSRASLLHEPSVRLSELVLAAMLLHLLLLGLFPAYRRVLPADWRPLHHATIALTVLWATYNVYYLYTWKAPSEDLVNGHRVLLGSACALNWLVLTAYLERRAAFRHLGETLRRTLPVAGRFVVGAVPLFGGYCMFGCIFFGHMSYHFASLDQTAVTLFSVLNGDIVLEIFQNLQDPNSPFVSLVSRVYLYTFIPLMLYGLVNIFLVITEESYRDAVKHSHHRIHVHRHSNSPKLKTEQNTSDQ